MWRIPRPAVLSTWKCETLHCRKTVTSPDIRALKPLYSFLECSNYRVNNLCPFGKSFKRTYCSFGDKNQHNNYKKYTFWNGTNFYCKNFPSCFFETVSWVGTAVVLGLSIQNKAFSNHQHCYADYKRYHQQDSLPSQSSHSPCYGLSCLLPYFAFTMPGSTFSFRKNMLPEHSTLFPEANLQNESSPTKKKVYLGLEDARQEFEAATTSCLAQLENLTALQLVRKSPKQAFKYFKAAGELGNSQAHFNLGVCYETGKGTQVNLEKAAEHYQLASKGGHVLATYNLGVYFWEGKGGMEKNPDLALKLIQQAAQQGMSLAQVFMGIHYYEQEKFAEAIASFTSAAEQENTDAQFYLATLYENGLGVQVDLEKSAELYTIAANQGHIEAMFSLVCFYEEGLGGLPKDVQYAATLYEKASNAGHLEAKTARYRLVEKLKTNTMISGNTHSDEGSSVNEIYSCSHKKKTAHNFLHISSSSPELGLLVSPSYPNEASSDSSSTSQYLNLIFPALFDECTNQKTSLYEEGINLETLQQRALPWAKPLRLLAANT